MKLSHTLTLALCVGLAACSGDDDDMGDDDGAPRDAGVTQDGGDDERDGGEVVRDGGPRDAGGERDGGPRDGGEVRDGGPPDIRIPGLSSPVDVKFDEYGVLHVRCQTDADCFRAEGYFHASERFPQMDIRRRFAAGRLAEVFGPLALDNDRATRHFISTRTGGSVAQQIWDNSDAASQAMVTAYTAGINAWIDDLRNDRNGAVLPPEYEAYASSVADWTEIDSIACILALIEQLTNQTDSEIRAGELASVLPADLFIDAFGLAPGSPSTILPEQIATFTGDLRTANPDLAKHFGSVGARLDHARDALRAARLIERDQIASDGRGSNNWVVDSTRTAGDYALLANDPHLGMSQPSVWYLVSLDSKAAGGNIHVAGASFAGLPGIILGQNEDIAWGATTTFFDMADVYVETLNTAGDAVILDGKEVPITTVNHTFNVLGGQPVTEPFEYVEHHGPVVSKDVAMGIAITIKWTGQEADTDLNVLHGLYTATTIQEARTAIENVTTIGQNWVVADRGGNIGWFPYNRVPNRPWNSAQLPSWLPVPGDGSAEWNGYVPYAELPQTLNPASGYVATANNDMTGHLADGDPTNDGQDAIQHYVATGYRHERIAERLEETTMHTRGTMQDIQADVQSLLAERTLPTILAAANAGSGQLDAATGGRVRDALAAWQYTCTTGIDGSDPTGPKAADPIVARESIGCAAFHVLFPRIVRGAFSDELSAAGTSRTAGDAAAIKLLTGPNQLLRGASYWDNVATNGTVETSTSVIVAAMNDAGTWLNANLGNSADDWRWGRVHTVTLTYDLISALTSRYNNGPYCNDGGLYTVDVANPGGRNSDNYAHGSGPSMRLACEAAPTAMACTIELPGGQSSFPTSPHYDDLLERWLVNDPIPVRFTPGDIDAAAVRELQVMAP
ncbi:MAG: penicillin acylase family protein [Deltaproteobacteria bacterium]